MYKRVSGASFWLLGYVTFGIYPLVIWGRITKNMNKMARKVGEKTISSFAVSVLLSCITFGIFGIIWTFKFFGLASRLNRRANAGVSPSNAFVMFIMSCIPIFSFFWMAGMNNKLADAYERRAYEAPQPVPAQPAFVPPVPAQPVFVPPVPVQPVFVQPVPVQPAPAQSAPAPSVNYCTQCGTPVPEDGNFCPSCGHKMN